MNSDALPETRFHLLGPVEVRHGDDAVPVPAARQRAILAALLLRAGRVVAVDTLTDLLWGDRPPPTATVTARNYVSRLRKAVPQVSTVSGGYRLDLPPGALDLDRFERLTASARTAAPAAAVPLLDRALALWRGPALADLGTLPIHHVEAPRLEEMRLAATGDRLDALLRVGEGVRLVPELVRLVARHPLRERFVGQLMQALDASGRLPEALDLYRRTRDRLVTDLAIEPGPVLRRLHQRLLETI
ncbi:AfsR/SARP family transcriptional regulator [Catenuloplanes atrovinosus]|uniref:DNA-binding SARP family transcriptional activator n=1 Tax=Catenuloplanes atrovinosus TaxID=137266 RepID=A0AAE3YRR6_9ACTN|nr:AfsR/SARP family transcriptional regulator [Catenuloplanes atrovinosus]MDR7277456.1 DNA-binding SARP family transcriptional activator [Catenuloplanes atrovinosus]